MIEIEKNIPYSRSSEYAHLWAQMVDGDSFFVPDIDNGRAKNIRDLATNYISPRGLMARYKRVSHLGQLGYRFWTLAKDTPNV
jgi:hypothetical protein